MLYYNKINLNRKKRGYMQTRTSKNTSQNFNKKNKTYNYLPPNTKNVFDYGCGRYSHNKDFCEENDIYWVGYDPFWKTKEENEFALKELENKIFDCIVCSNVLNVIDDEKEIVDIINSIKGFMNIDTIALFSCYSGDKTNIGLSTYFEVLYVVGDIFICKLKSERK